MITKDKTDKLGKLIKNAEKIVIIQADNPDGDSLSSALALEEIIEELGKQTYLYCGVDLPDYLKHIKGWDRVSNTIPANFDASIIVDTSANILLEKLAKSEYKAWVASKPVVVIDHHTDVACDIPYAILVINDNDAVATGEVVYKLSKKLGWKLNLQAKTHIASSILSDSLGLSSVGTTADTYLVMADLVGSGVDRPALEEARREYSKMPEKIFRYKAQLIERTEFYADSRIALVVIPDQEISEFSPLYNPAPLIQIDMLQTDRVGVAIVLKRYNDGKITGSIRCNYKYAVAADLAKHFGGGGHSYAAGFKLINQKDFESVKKECIELATKLLDNI